MHSGRKIATGSLLRSVLSSSAFGLSINSSSNAAASLSSASSQQYYACLSAHSLRYSSTAVSSATIPATITAPGAGSAAATSRTPGCPLLMHNATSAAALTAVSGYASMSATSLPMASQMFRHAAQASALQLLAKASANSLIAAAALHESRRGSTASYMQQLRAFSAAPESTSTPKPAAIFAEPSGNYKNWGNLPPVSFKQLLIAMMVAAGLITAIKSYRDEKLQQVMSQSQKVIGAASVGGPFELTDQDGKPFSSSDLQGEFAMLYFGFTHCPDICPDELEKLAEAITEVEKATGVQVQLVFISVDPDRDTPAAVKKYVKEFHPRMIGLTGDYDAVKRASKSYRVYFNKTGDAGDDYLVDHSIIHYLISPTGDFVTFYSKSYTAEQIRDSLLEQVYQWQQEHPSYHKGKALPAPAPKAQPAAKGDFGNTAGKPQQQQQEPAATVKAIS